MCELLTTTATPLYSQSNSARAVVSLVTRSRRAPRSSSNAAKVVFVQQATQLGAPRRCAMERERSDLGRSEELRALSAQAAPPWRFTSARPRYEPSISHTRSGRGRSEGSCRDILVLRCGQHLVTEVTAETNPRRPNTRAHNRLLRAETAREAHDERVERPAAHAQGRPCRRVAGRGRAGSGSSGSCVKQCARQRGRRLLRTACNWPPTRGQHCATRLHRRHADATRGRIYTPALQDAYLDRTLASDGEQCPLHCQRDGKLT